MIKGIGCAWLENNEGKGTCFLKDELKHCEGNSLNDCDKKTCVVKYNKCVPKDLYEVHESKPAESSDTNQSDILDSILKTQKKHTWLKKKDNLNQIYYVNKDRYDIILRGQPPRRDIIIDEILT